MRSHGERIADRLKARVIERLSHQRALAKKEQVGTPTHACRRCVDDARYVVKHLVPDWIVERDEVHPLGSLIAHGYTQVEEMIPVRQKHWQLGASVRILVKLAYLRWCRPV